MKHEYEIRQDGKTYRCGALLPDGKRLINGFQLPDDTHITDAMACDVLVEANRHVFNEYMRQSEAPKEAE